MDGTYAGLLLGLGIMAFSVVSLAVFLYTEMRERDPVRAAATASAADRAAAALQQRLRQEQDNVSQLLAETPHFISPDELIDNPVVERERRAAVQLLEARIRRDHRVIDKYFQYPSAAQLYAMLTDVPTAGHERSAN